MAMPLKRGNKALIASSTNVVPASTNSTGPCYSEVTGRTKVSSTQTFSKLPADQKPLIQVFTCK